MKKLTLILFTLILMPAVFSLYGGETAVVFNGECEHLIVNISIDPWQDEDEYALAPDCVAIQPLSNSAKVFKCICQDGRTVLNMTPAVNSLGNYTVVIDWYAMREEEQQPSGGGSAGSGGSRGSWLCGNWSECEGGTMYSVCYKPRNTNINFTKVKSCVAFTLPAVQSGQNITELGEKQAAEEPELPEGPEEEVIPPKEPDWRWGLLVMAVVIIVGVLAYIVIEKIRKKKWDKEKNEQN